MPVNNTGPETEPSSNEFLGNTPEEKRIAFHRLVGRVANVIRGEGKKARALRASEGGPNTRQLEEFEQRVLSAALALAEKAELHEILARVNEGAAKPSGDSAVYFTLSRLDGEGFVVFDYIAETESAKGKVLFRVTEDGERVLREAQFNKMWGGI
jgi:hypothetical protein